MCINMQLVTSAGGAIPSNCLSRKNPYRCDPNGGDGPLNGETFTAVVD